MSMEDLMTLPEVAKRVFLDCKKCDSGRYHIVLAHTSKTSAKVECEVCKSKKTFKLGKAKKSAPSKKSKSASSAKTGKVSVTKQLEKFTELKSKFASGQVLPYKMTFTFSPNTAIDHPKFGIGIVTEVAASSIQVTFQDEDRSLVHGRN